MDCDSIRFLAHLLGEELNWERPTLRDQFATSALQGLLAQSAGYTPSAEAVSRLGLSAYLLADLMMEARK